MKAYGTIIALVLSLIFHSTLAQNLFGCSSFVGDQRWLCEQKTHQPKILSGSQRQTLCSLTNYDEIKNHLDPIVNTTRVSGSPQIAAVGNFIQSKLQSYGYTVERDTFQDRAPFPHGVKTFSNIIATLNPQAPRRLVLACHYDSKYFPYPFYGATDSALPCALLLDLAITLSPYLNSASSNPKINEVSLQFIFFDGEEAFVQWSERDSLYGSRHLARKLQNTSYNSQTELKRIDVLVLLDLLGEAGVQIPNYNYGATHLHERLQLIERDLKWKRCVDNVRTIFQRRFLNCRGTCIADDHKPFVQRGVKALHIISSPFPRVWHNQYGIPDDKNALDPRTIKVLASVMRVFVAEYLHLVV